MDAYADTYADAYTEGWRAAAVYGRPDDTPDAVGTLPEPAPLEPADRSEQDGSFRD